VALEDPLTGEISCGMDGLKIDNCGAKSVKGSNQLFLRIQFSSDFTLKSLRKNLIIRNAGWVQRFPIDLEVDLKAILLANRFSNFSPNTQGLGKGDDFSIKMPAFRFFIVIITMLVTFQLKYAIDQTSVIISSEFPDLHIVVETLAVNETQPVTVENVIPKPVEELITNLPAEIQKPKENLLRKNHFKEQKVVSEIATEQKLKHIHKKWQIEKTDESAAESLKVDYSDRFSDSEDILITK
jgi:hypothetical protein